LSQAASGKILQNHRRLPVSDFDTENAYWEKNVKKYPFLGTVPSKLLFLSISEDSWVKSSQNGSEIIRNFLV
jgi:hypothetical protein